MESVLDILLDALLDAGKDTLIIIPFLLVTYIVMELIEHKTSEHSVESIKKAGKAGPIIGALFGAVPQCGFSTAAATLYSGRVITLGTLFAVFLSTSDEMLPIFIAARAPIGTILAVIITKIVIGFVFGFIIDLVAHKLKRESEEIIIYKLCEEAHCDCNFRCEGDLHEELEVEHPHHDHDHEHHHHGNGSVIPSAIKHTVQITIFIFLITFVINIIILCIGEESLASFLSANSFLPVAVSTLVGLIPNCAASAAIAQLYIDGLLGAGAMIGGLLSASGVGLLVLLRTNHPMKENIQIILMLFVLSLLVGIGVSLLGISF